MDSVCRDTLASNALRFTRASCQAAFDLSNATLALLGLERQLPPCVVCSLTEAMETARYNPLALLHLANPRTLGLVLHRHGPFGQLAQLHGVVHEGVREVAVLLAGRRIAGNATGAVTVDRCVGELLVRVETLCDPSFIVLTETKFSFRCIPVWDWYSPHRTRVEKKSTCDNDLTMTSPVHW